MCCPDKGWEQIMSRMLSRYLKDFGADQPAPAPASSPAMMMPTMSFDEPMAFAEPVEVPMIDIEAERREAYAEGHEAATASLTELHQAELETVRTVHQAEMDELRANFEAEAVERIAIGLEQIAAAVGLSVSNEAAKALSPLITQALSDKAVDELAKMIKAAFLDGAIGPVTVSGRRVMFDRLASRVDPDGTLLTFTEGTDIDLSVTIGDSVLVTRMSGWADGLKDILS
jgi:hypothetical protein